MLVMLHLCKNILQLHLVASQHSLRQIQNILRQPQTLRNQHRVACAWPPDIQNVFRLKRLDIETHGGIQHVAAPMHIILHKGKMRCHN